MKAIIYHNPRCSKSRKTLSLLKEKALDIEVIEYLKSPPSQQTLREIIQKLGIDAIDLVRKGETIFKELNLADKANNPATLLAAMVAHPILIERPIVLANDKAAIGRPPEAVLTIL